MGVWGKKSSIFLGGLVSRWLVDPVTEPCCSWPERLP